MITCVLAVDLSGPLAENAEQARSRRIEYHFTVLAKK